MPLDPAQYTPRHTAPGRPTRVALVAYERRDGPWDVFVFEPAGNCPAAWEHLRVDRDHVHVATIDHPDRLDAVIDALEAKLDAGFDKVPVFHARDPSKRGGLGRRLARLHKAGCTGYEVRHEPAGGETLYVRARDREVLSGLPFEDP